MVKTKTDKPILYSGAMVRALLAGRKTQTRRALAGAPDDSDMLFDWLNDGKACFSYRHGGLHVRCPLKYLPGDWLWVREAWRAEFAYNDVPPRDIPSDACNILYEANDSWSDQDPMNRAGKLRPSMFMPRWASRITQIVTETRVQRLQQISEEDAVAEGVYPAAVYGGRVESWLPAEHLRSPFYFSARDAYAALWDQINGPGSWDMNPWVAATSFTNHRCNIDQLAKG